MAAACALIPAAGRGVRFGGDRNKVLTPLLGRPLLGWTLEAFARCPEIASIVLIGAEGELETLWELGERYGGEKFTASVLGGATRQESVRLGLEMVPVECDTVVIHDAARCCVTPELITSVIRGAECVGGAASLAIPVTDTLSRVETWFDNHPDAGIGFKGETIPRESLWRIQTPQAFRPVDRLHRAHLEAFERDIVATDDLGLYQTTNEGEVTYLKLGLAVNIKVTTPEDLKLAEAILSHRLAESKMSNSENTVSTNENGVSGSESPVSIGESAVSSSESEMSNRDVPMSNHESATSSDEREISNRESAMSIGERSKGDTFRIGQGYDVHQLAEGRECWLGGVHFPEAKLGPVGHSDADVLLHAICDALLGAAGLGDIGKLFPPSDMAHKDRRSIEFLEEIKARLNAKGWQISNIDATVLAEAPKILPRAAEICSTIARTLEISPEQVSVKATTNEGLGFIGRGEGIAAHATALLRR
jgi:2-C-methyl-D-erythritol 2,4-cyclodiphosphate synthase/2-C-methyl-D-erythritol 4-phosphate cytidylyltransferase